MAPTLFEGAGDASRLLALLVVLATVHWVRVLSRRLAALEAAASTEVKQPLPSGSSDPDLTATPQPGSRNTLYGQTAAEATAGVRPADFTFPPGDCRRFGADPSGKADSTMAINTALRVPGATVHAQPLVEAWVCGLVRSWAAGGWRYWAQVSVCKQTSDSGPMQRRQTSLLQQRWCRCL